MNRAYTRSVRAGEFYASRDRSEVLETTSLGSCVGVALYDGLAQVAALCHILLDWQDRVRRGGAGWCADSALPAALARMEALGAVRERVVAHMAGGGNMFPGLSPPLCDVGMGNVAAARRVLGELGIPILSEDVGGTCPRKLRIAVATGCVTVRYPAGCGEP